MILPVDIDHDVPTLLGVILCIRHSVPHLVPPSSKDQGLKDSFGYRESEAEQAIGEEQMVKVIIFILFILFIYIYLKSQFWKFSFNFNFLFVTHQIILFPRYCTPCSTILATQCISDHFISQILQALLHYSGHTDHNVVTATLESLQQLLRTPPPILRKLLLTRGSISKTLIFTHDFEEDDKARIESEIQLNI